MDQWRTFAGSLASGLESGISHFGCESRARKKIFFSHRMDSGWRRIIYLLQVYAACSRESEKWICIFFGGRNIAGLLFHFRKKHGQCDLWLPLSHRQSDDPSALGIWKMAKS